MKKSGKDRKKVKKNKKTVSKKKGFKEIKNEKFKNIKEIKEESELEEDLVPEQFEEMPIDNTSKILSIARDLAFQPVVEPEEPLETMMEEVPGKTDEDEKPGKNYFEFKKDYEIPRDETTEEGERKYDSTGTRVDVAKTGGSSGALPFEREEERPGQAATFREDYLERKDEDKGEDERRYDARVKVKKA